MSLNGEDQSYQFDESAEDVDLSGISSKDAGDVDALGDESMQDDPVSFWSCTGWSCFKGIYWIQQMFSWINVFHCCV